MIPLTAEMNFENPNLESTVRGSFQIALARIKKEAYIEISGKGVPLSEIAYETEALEGLLEDADYPLLSDGKLGCRPKPGTREGGGEMC
jgi:predicted glycosyl hydrolase (DUF1957 family)